jgi:hypothetical protein
MSKSWTRYNFTPSSSISNIGNLYTEFSKQLILETKLYVIGLPNLTGGASDFSTWARACKTEHTVFVMKRGNVILCFLWDKNCTLDYYFVNRRFIKG